jgi:hypothetical protein
LRGERALPVRGGGVPERLVVKMNDGPTLIGEKLGSFRLESVLGSGAMGVVYGGTNEKTGKPAAIKVVSGEIAQRGKVSERFNREADILKQFRHPNIVRFLAVGRYQGTSYIAMEFITGGTLEQVIQERGHLPWLEVVKMGIQICDALHYAHERGVIHRDLKPSNLMVTEAGVIKLTDFGIAKDLDAESLTGTGRTLGTAAYMSPEQIRGIPPVSHKTDLYALGVLFYQMLAGKTPFEGASPVVLMHCHLNEPAPRVSSKVEEIPKALDELILNLMAKSPPDRPWDAAAVGHKLTELREKTESGARLAMVWPAAGSPEANPRRAGVAKPARGGNEADPSPGARQREGAGNGAAGGPRKKPRRAGTLSLLVSTFRTSRGRTTGDAGSGGIDRALIETLALAAGLVVVGGFIGYWLWPPSAEYLYRQAEPLMASKRRSDWITARDEYLDPLERRFTKNNPHHDQIEKLRDRILLDEAEGRSILLDAPARTRLNEPNTQAERQYVIVHSIAAQYTANLDDLNAEKQWRELSAQLRPDDPDDRGWYLLALDRANQLQNKMRDRRATVLKQLQLVQDAIHAGRPEIAEEVRKKLFEDYRSYTDLTDLFPATPADAPGRPADHGSTTRAASPGQDDAGKRAESTQPAPSAPPSSDKGSSPTTAAPPKP